MKYFTYFEKKLRTTVSNIHLVTPKEIVFENGLTLHYDFEKDVNTSNSTYKKDIHSIINGIKGEMAEEVDPRYFDVVRTLKAELGTVCAHVECVESDDPAVMDLMFLFHTGEDFKIKISKEKLLEFDSSAEEFDKFVNSIKTVDLSVLNKK